MNHEPAAPPERPDWLKIAFGAGLAAFGGYAFYKLFLEDPEVRTIRALARDLEDEGALVFTDIKGGRQPPSLNGRRPDIYAVFDDGEEIAIEVENDRSVDRHHARTQNDAFEKWERRSGRRFYEQVVVKGGRGGKR